MQEANTSRRCQKVLHAQGKPLKEKSKIVWSWSFTKMVVLPSPPLKGGLIIFAKLNFNFNYKFNNMHFYVYVNLKVMSTYIT